MLGMDTAEKKRNEKMSLIPEPLRVLNNNSDPDVHNTVFTSY